MADKMSFDLENFPISESAKRQLSYVSDGFYDNSYVGKWMFQVMGLEYDEVQALFESLPEQFFPESATWGLRFHEEKWGLPIRENLSYEERRKLIFQKRDFRAPVTPYLMEKSLQKITGFEVHVADVNDKGKYGYAARHPNAFKVYFLGNETLDSKSVHKLIDEMKQSHTTYLICDRVEDVINMSELEKIKLYSVKLFCRLWFWESNILDGTYLLNGSCLLDSQSKYSLNSNIKCKLGGIFNKETIENSELLIKKNLWSLNGTYFLDGFKVISSDTWKEDI